MTKTPKDHFDSTNRALLVIDCAGLDIEQLVFAPKADDDKGDQSYSKGPLLKAMEEGDRVLLRNVDQAKPGSGGWAILYAIIQLSTKERNEIDLYSLQSEKITLRREDVNGFDIAASITDPKGLPESIQYRLSPSRLLL